MNELKIFENPEFGKSERLRMAINSCFVVQM